MTNKLKIFTYDIPLNNVVEENLLFFGKVNDSIIINNNTFRDFNKFDFLNLVEYSDLESCDFIYYPLKIQKNSDIKELLYLSEKYNKKILLFYNDDNDEIFNFKNSIIFRTSLYKTNKPQNYYGLPAFCNNLKNESEYFFRKKNKLPTIGFCGALTHPLRRTIIDIFNNSELDTNFIIRNNFWGGDIWGKNVREEYINNTLNSDIIICLRGAGNFSYRLYETLCLGRIPLVIDTDIVLPFEEFVKYDDKIIKIQQEGVNNIIQEIISFWDKIRDYESLQYDLSVFWENNLSPIGFIKNLNLHKNEISNLLH
jgi:hypothetical protein